MYTTIDNLKKALGDEQELLLNKITDERLNEIINEKSGIMDSYLMVLYEVPFQANSLLEDICLNLSKAECFRFYARNGMPEDVENKEKKAFKDLVKIQQKKILIKPPEEDNNDIEFNVKPTYFTNWMY